MKEGNTVEATVAAIEPGRLAGTAAVPPSKSAAHRAVVCAALAAGTSHIGNVEFSQDILATLGAAQQLGAKVERGEHELTITGRGNADGFATITRPVFCNESGSTLRFIPPLVSRPAMGWLAMNSTPSGSICCTGSTTPRFTPETSVISVPGRTRWPYRLTHSNSTVGYRPKMM